MSASPIGGRFVAAAVVVLMNAGGAPAQEASPIPLKELKRHVGSEVLACGRVVLYECDDDAGALWLHLDKPYGGTVVVVPREHWPDSRGRSLTDQTLSSTICVRGAVRKEKGIYRLMIQGANRIEVRDAPVLPATFAPTALHTCAVGVTPPRLLREVKPSYTREAMRAKVQGDVHLEVEVLEDGSVGDVRELTILLHGLGQQAISAVKQWRFQPARLAGRPVPVVVTVVLTFTFW
jgi:TonB family protein